MSDAIAAYIEDVALFWEAQGLPRIGGRILGLLLVCDPPHRSATQLATELQVSKGSVSAMTRLLAASDSIHKVAIPGQRGTFYALTPNGLERKFTRRLTEMTRFEALATRGLALLADRPPESRERLEMVASLYAFMDRELPLLLEKWRRESGHV